MKNIVNLLKKSITDTRVSFVGDRIPMDSDTIQSLGSRIRMDLLLIAKADLWSQWICRQTVRVGSMIRTDPGSRSRDPFSGSTNMSHMRCLAPISRYRRQAPGMDTACRVLDKGVSGVGLGVSGVGLGVLGAGQGVPGTGQVLGPRDVGHLLDTGCRLLGASLLPAAVWPAAPGAAAAGARAAGCPARPRCRPAPGAPAKCPHPDCRNYPRLRRSTALSDKVTT